MDILRRSTSVWLEKGHSNGCSQSNVETGYVRYTFHDSFRKNQFMGKLEYHKRDCNESRDLEL